jgi:hypothetical protein
LIDCESASLTLALFSYGIIGLAYPLFNSFLPLYLTQIPGETTNGAYRNYIIQAACGVPRSIIASALVEWKVRGKWSFIAGRKGALAWCTIASGVFLVRCHLPARPLPRSQLTRLPSVPLHYRKHQQRRPRMELCDRAHPERHV